MAAVVSKTTMAMADWEKILSLNPLMLTAIIHDTLKFEVGQIVALKELLRQRDTCVVSGYWGNGTWQLSSATDFPRHCHRVFLHRPIPRSTVCRVSIGSGLSGR